MAQPARAGPAPTSVDGIAADASATLKLTGEIRYEKGRTNPGWVLLLFAIYIGYESTLIEAGADFGKWGRDSCPSGCRSAWGLSSAGLLVRAVVLPADRFAPIFFFDRAGRMRVIWVFAGYLLAVVVMKPLGMLISLAILMAITMPAFGSRNWKVIALTAIAHPYSCVSLCSGSGSRSICPWASLKTSFPSTRGVAIWKQCNS